MNKLAVAVFLVSAVAAQALDQSGYDAKVAEAKERKRPLVVVAAAPSWDEASGKLVAALNDPALEGWLARESVAVRLDPSVEGEDGARGFAAAQLETLGIHEVPSIAVFDGAAELGRISFEAQTAADLERALVTMIQGRRGWQERLARLEGEEPAARLIDAAHLFRNAAPVLGRDLVRVAHHVFTLDPANTTGMRADAAMMVASVEGGAAKLAIDYLESIAATDTQKRFGFVMWSKSGRTLERLLEQQALVKAKKAAPATLRPIATELIAQVNKARPHAPNDDVRGQLMVRAAVAFKIVGEQVKAEAALTAARALAARWAAANPDASNPQVAAVP